MIKEHVLDAKNKILGRIASETALLLRGKKEADFTPNKMPNIKVKIINASQMKIGNKKLKNKTYRRHSHYPGGQKIEVMEKVLNRKSFDFIIRHAVLGMLPKNRTQKKVIKNLIISN
jgi:large subunit ribosomal protein L13